MALPLILGLAKFAAPRVLGLLTGISGNVTMADKAAGVVSQVAQAVTGTVSDTEALEILGDNPELQIEFRKQMNDHAVEMYAEETERLKGQIALIKTEHANEDGYVRRMRPTFGYVGALCTLMMFSTVTYAMLFKGIDDAVKMIKAYSGMEWIMLGLFSVIGVYVVSRSKDKKPSVMGLIGSIAKRIGK